MKGYDFRDRFQQIEADTLIVRGDRDAVPLASTFEIKDLIGGSVMELMEGVGHFPFIEAKDRFNGLVKDFLQG